MPGIGERLRELREFKGLARSELAQLAGTTYMNIYNCELKGTRPRPATLEAISRVLSTTPDYLLRGVASEPTDVHRVLREAKATIAEALQVDVKSVNLRLEIGV